MTIKTIYITLESFVLSGITSLITNVELAQDLLFEISSSLLSKTVKASPVSRILYNKVTLEIAKKLKELSNEPEEFTVEEVKEKINQLSEEEKVKINEVIEKGVGAQWAYKCYTKGVKDYESVSKYVEETAPVQIYKLGPIDDTQLSTNDVHGTAEIYQNNLYYLVINDNANSHKSVKFNLPKTLFHGFKYFVTEVTVRAVLEKYSNNDEIEYGLNIGDLNIRIENSKVFVQNEAIGDLQKSELIIRINANSNGKVEIVFENVGLEAVLHLSKVFNGVQVGELEIFLNKGNTLSLVSLEVYDGRVVSGFNGKIEKGKKNEGGERSVKIKKRSANADRKRLKLLGINETEAEAALNSSENFIGAVLHSLQHYSPSLPVEVFNVPNTCISELKLFEPADQIPADFQTVLYVENFKPIDFALPNRKILAYKVSAVTKSSKALVGLSILENNGGEQLGDFTIGEADRTNPIFAKVAVISAKDQPIRDIIYIKASSIYNVGVPDNYDLVSDKEGKIINIAPKAEKDYYLFVAVSKTVTVLTIPVLLLENIPNKGSTYGLAESKKPESANKKEEKEDFSAYSITELYSLLQEYELSRKSSNSITLLSKILEKNGSLLIALAEKYSLSKILSLVDSKLITNITPLISNSEFNNKLASESISILISSLISKSGSKSLKTLTIESTHPYDNSMDVDDVITIPGAKGLRIEFDPQCYTESGCDPLRFYENAGRTGEIKCLSGQGESNWQSFEIPGDTVYTYFHSDGSVNYWGYKFDVIPIGGGKGGDDDEVNPEIALNILKALSKIEGLQKFLTSDKVLAPLFLFLLGSTNPLEKSKTLDLLRNLVVGQNTTIYTNILKSLTESALQLYNSTKTEKVSHETLQSLIILLCEAQKHSDLKIKDSWFLDFSDLLSDMSGFTYKNSSLETFLFENFKVSGSSNLDKEYESSHPYAINTTSSLIKIEGAHSLNIEFTKESKAEDRHTLYFSTDPEGKQDLESENSTSTVTAKWETKGPDVVVDQDDKRATRTNSTGWGAVVAGTKFSTGINSITFLIENTGDSGYLYVGLIEADENNNYDLGTCLNSDYSKRVWVWRKSGELHLKGSNFSAAPYETGNLVTFVVNSIVKTITCLLNNIEVHTFTNIADVVVPAASFGGSNQFVVIQKIDSIGASTLESKKITVPGDSAYLWFPVNTSAKLKYKWDTTTDDKGTLSLDKETITKVGDSPFWFLTSTELRWGKHYFQVKVLKPGKTTIGLHLQPVDKEIPIETAVNILYDSEGTVEELKVDPYGENDIIGIFVDFESNAVEFYKNDSLVTRIQGKLLENLETQSYKFVGVLYAAEQSLSILAGHPSHLNLLSISSDLVSKEWGYKFKVTPEFKGRSYHAVQNFLASSPEEFNTNWTAYKNKYIAAFQSNAAEELVSYIDQFSASKGKEPTAITQEEIEPQESELVYYPELEKLSKEDIKKLFLIIQQFNKRVENSLYLFNLNIGENISDMQKVLLGSRNYIFFKLKNDIFKKVLEKTKNDIRTEINIDRPKAARHRLKKEIDSEGQFSIFGQIYRAMAAVENKGYRNSERVYKINYRGEASIDAGGPYNESMSNICDELQSSFLRLFVQTQNNVHNMGENRET